MKSFLQFLQRAAKYFRGTKRVWRKPPQTKLLIIDQGTASPLDEMFAEHNPHVMAIRGESINMLALLRALPKIHLGALAYVEAYIDFVKPKLILSRTDNNPTMWQLKRRPNATYQVALVQNGWRLEAGFEIPQLLNETGPFGAWEIDQLFAFGPAWISQIPNYAKFNGVSSGSIKANQFTNESRSDVASGISWISTFRSGYIAAKNDIGDLFYKNFAKVLKLSGQKLKVIGFESGVAQHHQENEYFNNYFKTQDLTLNRRTSSKSSYELVQSATIVLTDQSSLGYESLVLGCKTGFIAAAPRYQITHRFGKPLEFGEKGPFWTNDPSEAEIGRILDYLLTVSDEQWERDSGWIRDQLMAYDFGNTKIRAYVESVLADSLKDN